MKKRNKAGTLARWGERGLIKKILTSSSSRGASPFLLPPGDDACVLKNPSSAALSIDGLVDGVHFKTSWASPLKRKYGLSLGKLLGEKLLRSALSDLCATGKIQHPWAMVFLGAPGSASGDFLLDINKGVKSAAARFGCVLAGGDTVRSSKLVLCAAVGGTLLSRPLKRKKARPGDFLCHTGSLGDAQAGLSLLLKGPKGNTSTQKALVKRFFQPELGWKEGAVLAQTPGVVGAMDLSDSLHESIILLQEGREPSIEIDLGAIGVSAAWKRNASPRASLITAAEDYGLLFSASGKAVEKLRRKIKFSVLGRFDGKKRGIRYLDRGRRAKSKRIFSHFA